MSDAYTSQELMIAVAAREIRDRELVFVGMRLPIVAYAVARNTHAPNARGLVERVSFITSPGHGDGSPDWRRRHGLLGGGPAAIITTLCVFRFPSGGGEAYVDTVHPGSTLAEVREMTGWDVSVGADVGETP